MGIVTRYGQSAAFIQPNPDQGVPAVDGWHVVQVFTGKEQKVCDDLRDAGWQAYSPMAVKWRKPTAHQTAARLQRLSERRTAALQGVEAITDAGNRSRALAATLRRFPQVSSLFGRNPQVEKREAFIPGYVFVASEKERGVASIIGTKHRAGIEGVTQILRLATGDYARIPQGIVDALMQAETMGLLEANRKQQNQFKLAFKTGQEVRILGGPFDGLIGKVMRANRAARIGVMLDVFGKVDVDVEQVEAVS